MTQIAIDYNTDLQQLEDLLSKISCPGDFFMQGEKEIPLPTVQIEGIGTLSFPLLEGQVKEMIDMASLAPYGKGEETIFDTSVRKTWQISANNIHISGKSWQTNFSAILEEVKNALGCRDCIVTAELYKLLIYDTGSFFLPHRDSEKSPGMFGTMVIALPSFHEGGDLVVRHKESTATIDLSGAEGSELKFGAFYADCEHEVLPITKGYRVCLVYNLIQKTENQEKEGSLKAPDYVEEMQIAATMLKEAFKKDKIAKIVWLFEHHYSKAELSFQSLKNADAAITKVLTHAAENANCAIYLGIVHITESGGADADFGYSSHRSRRGYYEDEMDVDSDDYEIIDIDESTKYIDDWKDLHNRSIDFNSVPIESGELLPCDALDGVEPDEQRLLEATGNAGITFERAYHRAALILWPKENYIKVLLQSGIKNGIVYFKEQMSSQNKNAKWHADMSSIATAIIKKYAEGMQSRWFSQNADAAEMLKLLCQFQETALIKQFIASITTSYSGAENEALILAADLLHNSTSIDLLFSGLFKNNMSSRPVECINLYSKLTALLSKKFSVKMGLNLSSQEVVNGLKSNHPVNFQSSFSSLNFEVVVLLWHALNEWNMKELQNELVSIIIENQLFSCRDLVLPVLVKLQPLIENSLLRLWEYSCNFLLTKSEYPPTPPTDWAQEVTLCCSCEDCKDFQTFVKSPDMQTFRFQMQESRRNHILYQLQRNLCDMSTRTDESRRPYTLVCTKTRKKYEGECREYQLDIQAMKLLLSIFPNESKFQENQKRLMQAISRDTNNKHFL